MPDMPDKVIDGLINRPPGDKFTYMSGQ
ncbi:hypothetical protein SBDP1_800018 [Syntrophobacter sp. SbD1]|nr:hypothetical protein SBDP1_800018 [Syntrophobacter sp. SbD1]